MAPPQKLGPLNDKEKAEFDNIRYDEIQECKDVKKLMRLEAYMREEGFPTTAEVAVGRLRELGQRAANAEIDPEQARLQAEEQARARAEIAAWTAKQRQTDAALEAASKEAGAGALDGGMPPIRAPMQQEPVGGKPQGPAASQNTAKPKMDSAVGTNVRSGRDYYDLWEKKVEAALAEADRDDTGAAAARAGAAATAASTAGLARSPELTARLLELNRGRSAAERQYLSGVEKAKGNDHFRAKDYAEAVEHYTLALGLRGHAGEPSLFSNRAAAYLKLKMWDAAEQDTSAALEADPSMLKAYIRRGAARLELGKLADCVADCDAALALQPGCRDAEEVRTRAAKLLQDAGMKRMSIEEVEDEEEEEEEEAVGAPSKGAVAAAAATTTSASAFGDQSAGQDAAAAGTGSSAQPLPPKARDSGAALSARKKLVVVEESDSEDSDEEPAPGPSSTAAEQKQVQPAPAVAAVPGSQPPPQAPESPEQTAGAVAEPSNVAHRSEASPPSSPAKAPPPTAPSKASAAAPATTVCEASAPSANGKPVRETSHSSAAASTSLPQLKEAAVRAAAVPPPKPPPPLPPLELSPAPTPPAPTPASRFDASVEAIKLEGNSEFKKGNFVRAAQLYTEALALAPDSAVLYLNRSMARLSSGLNTEALRDACLAVALDPSSYKAVNKRARAKEKLRLWEGARDDMQRCLDLMYPKDKARGDVEKELQKAEANVAAVEERAAKRAAAAAARPQRVTNYARARVTIEEHDDDEDDSDEDKPLVPPEQAEEWEAAAVRQLPQLRSTAKELRDEWLRQRDAEAREAYTRELLGWEAAKERAEAEAAAAAAAEAEAAEAAAPAPAADAEAAPRTVEMIKNEGNEHLKAKRYEQAEECYRECLRLDPDNVAVRLNLMVLLNATERWAESEAGADKALELLSAGQSSLTPEQQHNLRPKVFHRRALARKAMGRLLEARDDLRAAKALMGQSVQLDEELGAIGKLIAADREAAAVAAAPEAAPASASAAPKAKDATEEPSSASAAASAADAPAPTPSPPEATSAPGQPKPLSSSAAISEAAALPAAGGPVVEPVRPRSTPVTTQPAGPVVTAAAAAGPTSSSAASGSGGSGPAAPVRRRMEVQVESDDSDEDLPPSGAAPQRPIVAPAQPQPQTESQPQSQRQQTAQAAAATPASTSKPVQPPSTGSTLTPAATTPSATASNPPAAPAAAPAAAATATATKVSASANGREVSGDPGNAEEAARLRDEGNRLYGVGNYVRAMDFYTRSIRASAHNPAAYCNRAFVYLHLRRPADALLDAEAAIEQAGGRYPKAQLRRALALRDLGRIPEAMTAVRQLLDAAPGDEALLEEMQRLQRMAADAALKGNAGVVESPQQAAQGQAAKLVPNGGEAPRPMQAPPVRHKILVEEASSDSSDGEEDAAVGERGGRANGVALAAGAAVAAAASTSAISANGFAAASVQASQPEAAVAAPSAAAEAAPDAGGPSGASTVSTSTEGTGSIPASNNAETPSPAVASAAESTAASASASKGDAAAAAAAAAGPASGGGRSLQEASAKAAAALAVAGKTPKKPKPPKNAHELEQALKTLAGHPFVMYDYVRSLDPTTYAGVIKANLSIKMMQAFVDTARQAMQLTGEAASVPVAPSPKGEDVEFTLRSLESLTLVPRFDVTYGLCGKGMKEDMRTLVGALAAAGKDVSLLKKSYKL